MDTNKDNAVQGPEMEEMEAVARTGGASAPAEDEGDGLILKLRKPYKFEGETYTEIDLTGLEDTTGADLIAVERRLKKMGIIDPLIEMSPELACHMAARVSKKPVELFEQLPTQELIRLKNMVTGFLYGGDGED